MKPYPLDERTQAFAIRIRRFLKKLPRTPDRMEDMKQLMRSSGSVGANYIEACECLGKKDRLLHMRICLKEAKESSYWLMLLKETLRNTDLEYEALIQETKELVLIFSSIIQKLSH